ncbi:hypothetical protein MycrhN_1553 [Mycolicibacterium rhodesiae NBB3]|jgi:uncharacterized protein (DUF305 family)|uniref:DUF305 domain-containing protein n=1 Tax=Mycolicibacterium rhodesiae (strain NBB3) TaxID=710685 RepID=G8RI19_MYCRN|nr:DUF305 domain-containing protein [Mycolicibacterium rhodesiae]AEV72169.1 hypothetical protein MycrhN_1553 [Mycolicibacterium rhodesiae NBB3]
MPSRITRIVAVPIALFAAIVLSSCSGSQEHTGDHPTEESVSTAQPPGFNADDHAFATNMIPHHQQAIELSAMAPDHSTNPELVALAAKISAEQEPEIKALRVFLVQWDENPDDDASQGEQEGHGGHGAMAGMVDEATMTKLQSLRGAEFDTLWLQSMISHHQGAIEMAKAEVAHGQNEDVKRMAQGMIDAQQAEIDQMKQMLEGGHHG